MPGLVAAGIFSFITSFDEFFISQFLSSVDTVTLPVQVFNVLQYNVDPSVTAVSAILITVAVVALALVGVVRKLSGSGKQQGLLPTEPGVGLSTGSETAS
jgi:putative spermidine/putrescine transport system permease protein